MKIVRKIVEFFFYLVFVFNFLFLLVCLLSEIVGLLEYNWKFAFESFANLMFFTLFGYVWNKSAQDVLKDWDNLLNKE